MSDIVDSCEFRNRAADQALVDGLPAVTLARAICDGQRGYVVHIRRPDGSKSAGLFHYRLSTAIGQMLEQIGHGADRDFMVLGESEVGNSW